VRAHAYWQFFRGWSDQGEPVPAEVADRLTAFWAWRLDELEQVPESEARTIEIEGLMWFLSTPYLPVQQAITLGRRTIALNTGKRRVTGNGWERMADLANEDPDGAYGLIGLLVEHELQEHGLVLFDQIAPALRIAMQRGSVETRASVIRLVNRLGEAGQDEFKQLLPGPQ
jgi:hypothetical protein